MTGRLHISQSASSIAVEGIDGGEGAGRSTAVAFSSALVSRVVEAAPSTMDK